tara:strand:+ start:1376 stop:2086 length:711 start_codon:yes stop_codon:yes gene_type:complete
MLPEINLKAPKLVDNKGEICFIFFHEPGTFSYSRNVLAILESYCKKHKYDILVFDTPNPEYWHKHDKRRLDAGVCWHKAMACITALDKFDYKKYAWFDSDIVITNMDKSIDEFFTNDFVGAKDVWSHIENCQLNSGLFFFKDTPFIREVFKELWDTPRWKKGHNDQMILWDILSGTGEDARPHLKTSGKYTILDSHHFNAHYTHWNKKSLVVHMMGSARYIRNWIAQYFKEQVYEL